MKTSPQPPAPPPAGSPGPNAAPPATPPETIESLQAKLASANQQIADYRAADAVRSVDETAIAEKMRHGLNRAQPGASIRRQREFDAKNPTRTRAYHTPDKTGQSQFTKAHQST
jgi:hypothetical protein